MDLEDAVVPAEDSPLWQAEAPAPVTAQTHAVDEWVPTGAYVSVPKAKWTENAVEGQYLWNIHTDFVRGVIGEPHVVGNGKAKKGTTPAHKRRIFQVTYYIVYNDAGSVEQEVQVANMNKDFILETLSLCPRRSPGP